MVRLFLFGAALAGLTACTTALPPEKTDALGIPFNDELKTRYLALASSERDALDWDYFHYREKADASLLGDLVEPDRVADHDICLAMQPESLKLEEWLAAALDGGGRLRAPQAAAEAQVSFDCWLDELEAISSRMPAEQCQAAATHQPSQCRDRLMLSLDQVEAALIGEDSVFAVFFDSGESKVDPEGMDTVAEAVRAAELLQPTRIRVVGFADRHGLAADNQKLSDQRARAVARALMQKGIPAALVVIEAGGETTAKEDWGENRRVEILFDS
jgi:outer membrane protein OmpA-like peptidoglycan-associated protein